MLLWYTKHGYHVAGELRAAGIQDIYMGGGYRNAGHPHKGEGSNPEHPQGKGAYFWVWGLVLSSFLQAVWSAVCSLLCLLLICPQCAQPHYNHAQCLYQIVPQMHSITRTSYTMLSL